MATVSRMRTVKAVVEYFKQEDPDSEINEYFLRKLVKQGKVPGVYAGNKLLINMDKFIEFLNSDVEEPEVDIQQSYGTLRKVIE